MIGDSACMYYGAMESGRLPATIRCDQIIGRKNVLNRRFYRRIVGKKDDGDETTKIMFDFLENTIGWLKAICEQLRIRSKVYGSFALSVFWGSVISARIMKWSLSFLSIFLLSRTVLIFCKITLGKQRLSRMPASKMEWTYFCNFSVMFSRTIGVLLRFHLRRQSIA